MLKGVSFLCSTGTQFLVACPTQCWRGLMILFSGSSKNQFQWASQPAILGIMKRTGNMSVGKPMALQMIPLQKSTLGQSFLSIKYGSLRAIFSSSIAIQMSPSFPVIWKTQSAIFLMIVALGSQFLQTLCPNPYKRPSFFFTLSMNLGMFYFLPIDSNILKTASLAPPCFGPQRAPVAPAIVVQTSTPDEDRCLTAAVEQFSSCSACKMNRTYKAWTSLG